MSQRLDGYGVLITGGSTGLGLSHARVLGGRGARVAITDFKQDNLDRAAAELKRGGVEALCLKADNRVVGDVKAAAAKAEAEFGKIDVLVNNAGITGPLRDVHDYEGGDMAAVLLTNVAGYVRVIHAFLPLLERSPDPRIVNVSSGLGSFGLAHDESRSESRAPSPLYAAAKSAINMLTVRYAQLLPGIRINSADPGMTATDLSGGRGHSVEDGTDAIIAFALGGPDSPTGAFRDRTGDLPW